MVSISKVGVDKVTHRQHRPKFNKVINLRRINPDNWKPSCTYLKVLLVFTFEKVFFNWGVANNSLDTQQMFKIVLFWNCEGLHNR
jgi:hypothetical protein